MLSPTGYMCPVRGQAIRGWAKVWARRALARVAGRQVRGISVAQCPGGHSNNLLFINPLVI